MKKQNKLQKAEYLLCELSGVEDRYLAQALAFRKPQRANLFRRTALLAACLTLSFVLCISVLLLNDRKDESMNGDLAQNSSEIGEQSFVWKLDTVLQDSEGMSATQIDAETFDFFSGESRVVWQYEGDAHFYMSRALTKKEVTALRNVAKENTQKPSSFAKEPNVRVWVVEADGTVWTPYLQYTDGNLAAAAFFDYHAEIVPSDDWISWVSDLIFN